MKAGSTIILMLVINLAFSQERLTTILSEKTNAIYFAETIDEVNYLLKINQNGKLDVNILNSDQSLTFLHSKVFKGYFTNYEYFIDGDVLHVFDDITPIIYNFVEDKEIRIDIPEEWIPSNWRLVKGDFGLIRVSDIDNEEDNYFLVNETGEILSEGPSLISVIDIIGNYLLKIVENNGSGFSSYYLEHVETGIQDTILENVSSRVYSLSGDYMTYFTGDGKIQRINIYTGEKIEIPFVSYSPENILDVNVLGDFFFVKRRISTGVYRIEMYELNTGTYMQSFSHEEIEFQKSQNIAIAQGKVVIQEPQYLLVFDIDSGESSAFVHSFNSSIAPIIEDRYLFSVNSWQSSFIDLVDGEEYSALNNDGLRPSDYSKILPVGDSYLGIFSSYTSRSKSIFELDIENFKVEHLISIDDTNEGLYDYDTELIKYGENLVLASEDIYKVDGAVVTKINPYDLKAVGYTTPYRKRKDYVSFLCENEDDDLIMYTYDGIELVEQAIISKSSMPFPIGEVNIIDYVITSNYVYFVQDDFGFKTLMRYSKFNGEITEITNAFGFGFARYLFKSGEDVYYYASDEVYHIDDLGELSFITTNDNGGISNYGLVEHNGLCYNIGDNEISILEGSSKKTIFTGDFEINYSFSHVELPNSFMINLKSTDIKNRVLYIEGEDVTEVRFDYGVSSISAASNNHYSIYTYDQPLLERKNYIFNGNNLQSYDISGLDIEDGYASLFFKENSPHLVTHNYQINKALIYEVENNYSNASLKFQADYFDGILHAEYVDTESKGMINAGELIALVDNDFNVTPLNVKGNGRMPELIEMNDGYVYFIGSDVIYGYQLFRIDPSEIPSKNNNLSQNSYLKLHPNPSSDYLFIDGNLMLSRFNIMDNQGRAVLNGVLNSNRLDISSLPSGIFFIKIESQEKSFSGSFIKS